MFRKHYNISPFDTKKSAKEKMKSFRRGYLIYKNEDKLFIFRKIKGELNRINLTFDKLFSKYLCLFFNEFNKVNFDLVISQYTFQKSRVKRIYLDMLLYTYKRKKILQPLNFEYFKILRKNNYEVSPLSYRILWPLFSLLFWIYGNYLFFSILIKSLFNIFKKGQNIDHYFFGINESNLPNKNINSDSRESYDLISWFNKYFKKNSETIKVISHDNPNLKKRKINGAEIFYSQEPWFYINGIIKLIIFLISGCLISLCSFLFIIFNRCSVAFLFPEILKAISTILSDKKKISKKYMFHYSETFYRPLWTYVLEKHNVEIICYFYSAYDNPTNKMTNEIGYWHEFGNISWPKIFVWDELTKKKISKYLNKNIENIEIVNTGPIWFSDTNFIFKEKKKRIIIFDMTVHRTSVHYGFYDTAEYTDDVDNFNCLYLRDIFSTFKYSNYEIILKRKRPNNYLKTNYRNLVKKLVDEGLIIIDEPVSPYYLIKNSDIVFSTPFTSANLLSDNYKNNFYYDPINRISKDDIASRGLPIISGLEELNKLKNQII